MSNCRNIIRKRAAGSQTAQLKLQKDFTIYGLAVRTGDVKVPIMLLYQMLYCWSSVSSSSCVNKYEVPKNDLNHKKDAVLKL